MIQTHFLKWISMKRVLYDSSCHCHCHCHCHRSFLNTCRFHSSNRRSPVPVHLSSLSSSSYWHRRTAKAQHHRKPPQTCSSRLSLPLSEKGNTQPIMLYLHKIVCFYGAATGLASRRVDSSKMVNIDLILRPVRPCMLNSLM